MRPKRKENIGTMGWTDLCEKVKNKSFLKKNPNWETSLPNTNFKVKVKLQGHKYTP